MKIRNKLILIGIIPVALLLTLTALFLWATSQVERATHKVIVADELASTLSDLARGVARCHRRLCKDRGRQAGRENEETQRGALGPFRHQLAILTESATNVWSKDTRTPRD